MTVDVLVIGAQGQVGHELLNLPFNHSRVGFDRTEIDIADSQALMALIHEQQPRLLINAAAYTAVDKAESDEAVAYAVNAGAVESMARCCQELGIPMLHISTDYVFSGEKSGAYLETDNMDPQGVYGASKAEGDRLLEASGIDYISLRVSWVFGAHGNNFVRTMLRLGAEREELGIVADQHGCPTSARSIAQALLNLSERILSGQDMPWGLYHFSNFPVTTWHGFAQNIFAQNHTLSGSAVPKLKAIATADYPTPAKRPANSELDCSRFTQTFAIEQADWREELADILKSWRDERD